MELMGFWWDKMCKRTPRNAMSGLGKSLIAVVEDNDI